MKYNPTNHSIEYDDGALFCKLSESVSTQDAYGIADNILIGAYGLKNQAEEIEDLKKEISDAESEIFKLEEDLEDLEWEHEQEMRQYNRRKIEPDCSGWWWLYHEYNLHPCKVFYMSDQMMIQFANQTIPFSQFKEENPEYRTFYKAYEPE